MTGGDERQDKLIGVMLQHFMRGKETCSFKQLSSDMNFMERTTSWRNSWKTLLNEKKFIEIAEGTSVFTGECRLTQAGKDHASTPEYVEFLKELNFVPQTNEEHQARIKKKLLNTKGAEIFQLLLTHGSLTRKELSTILCCNDRQHKFSYGLKDLKRKELVEVDPTKASKKKLRLTDKAFLTPEDRPIPTEVDPEVLKQGILAVESKKHSAKKKKKKEAEEKNGTMTKSDGDNEEEGPRSKKRKRESLKEHPTEE